MHRVGTVCQLDGSHPRQERTVRKSDGEQRRALFFPRLGVLEIEGELGRDVSVLAGLNVLDGFLIPSDACPQLGALRFHLESVFLIDPSRSLRRLGIGVERSVLIVNDDLPFLCLEVALHLAKVRGSDFELAIVRVLPGTGAANLDVAEDRFLFLVVVLQVHRVGEQRQENVRLHVCHIVNLLSCAIGGNGESRSVPPAPERLARAVPSRHCRSSLILRADRHLSYPRALDSDSNTYTQMHRHLFAPELTLAQFELGGVNAL